MGFICVWTSSDLTGGLNYTTQNSLSVKMKYHQLVEIKTERTDRNWGKTETSGSD